MGTRRRHRRHRGGDPLTNEKLARDIKNLQKTNFNLSLSQARELAIKNWKDQRKAEEVEDRGLEKIKEDRTNELENLARVSPVKARIHEEQEKLAEKDIESTRAADEKKRRNECRDHLRSHDPALSSPKAAKQWLENKDNRRANPQDYAEVRDCVRILTSTGAGRKTRRRKSRRRR